ncbi:lysophospholipid acyltransferase family protein [Phragmitibacter flavus]|uniref:Lysophospholipid acyltransferase family protein n=1 Tax=Phragmitibacter flavus TaxID=2576071 RepID=A0A5R8KK28_9BACT|nr:GNAT family N-acyltransferase [Phragmitibacter flavus]TLD71969.1 lysophospholipid acyltransferase family protein [Phragmitibacter flavus]
MVIDLSSKLHHPVSRQLYKAAAPLVERSLHIRGFNDLYERTRLSVNAQPDTPAPFAWFTAALQQLKVRCDLDTPKNFTIPQGPLIVVSNHPFGLLDPLILGHYLSQHRPDLRIMTNFLLNELEDIRPLIVPVDPFHHPDSPQRNLRPIKECLRHLKKNHGALAIFPSGEVAHYQPGHGIQECPWSDHVGALARRSEAAVLPVYFKGRNSVLFQTAGILHPRLRTSLLLRELFDRSRHPVTMRIGRPIPYSRLKHFDNDTSLTRYLRLQTLVLGQPNLPKKSAPSVAFSTPSPSPNTPSTLTREVAALPPPLAQQGHLAVHIATASQIPHLLQEIGRCRELTFRTVGEGTGNAIDLDRFDPHYLHLFLWDHQNQTLAGAYRIGRCDQLLRAHGKKGLYTHTLFKYKNAFTDGLHNALELGRSFILPTYQRNPAALPLLWKGVFTWISQHPQYRRLFGPVTISQDYQQLSKRLMVSFLTHHRADPTLTPHIRPRKPFHKKGSKKLLREFISADLREVDDFSAVIASLEADGKGLPILLKHYLRLNGTLLSFNVDKSFSNCLDGLIHVDLLNVEPRLITKYLGPTAATQYLAHHQSPI